jgi:hypothetical protein
VSSETKSAVIEVQALAKDQVSGLLADSTKAKVLSDVWEGGGGQTGEGGRER